MRRRTHCCSENENPRIAAVLAAASSSYPAIAAKFTCSVIISTPSPPVFLYSFDCARGQTLFQYKVHHDGHQD